MAALLDTLANQPVRCVLSGISGISGIALPNDASVALHQKFGFIKVGIFPNYAQKMVSLSVALDAKNCFEIDAL